MLLRNAVLHFGLDSEVMAGMLAQSVRNLVACVPNDVLNVREWQPVSADPMNGATQMRRVGAGGQVLTAEDSTRAIATGSPFTPPPVRPANSEQSRQAVVREAPLDIEYDVEVDCKT